MAGPSLIPGQTGSMQLGGSGGGQPGDQLLQIISAVQQIQGQKQQQAQGQLGLMMKMIELGLPPEEKDFMKTAEAAGVPIKAISSAVQKPGQVTKMGNTLQGQGAQAAFPVSDSAANKAPAGGVTKTVPAGTGAVEKGVGANNQAAQSPFDQLIARAQEKISMASQSEAQKFQLEKQVGDLKLAAMSGDPTATGKLMAMGGMDFNLDQVMWGQMSPQEKQTVLDMKAGMESPAAKETRLSNQAISLFGSGRFNSLTEARQAAEGKQVAMKPDLTRMVDEAKMFNELIMAGLSPSQAREAGQKVANGASLAEVMPEGTSPVILQQLQAQKAAAEAQVQGEQQRTQIDLKRLDLEIAQTNLAMLKDKKAMETDAYKFMVEMQKANDEAFNKRFDNFVNAQRAGVQFDSTFTDNMMNELAARSGMTPEKVKSITQWLSFGLLGKDKYTFKPDLSKDQSLIDSATKKGPKVGIGSLPQIENTTEQGIRVLTEGMRKRSKTNE